MKRLLGFVALATMLTVNTDAKEEDSLQYDIPEIEVAAKYISPVSISGETMQMRRMPQSVSVVNPKRIKEMNITTIDQAMQHVTGVTVIANDNMRSQYRSRGYSMSVMTDGMPAYNSLALSQQFDLSFFEQVEVLRGVSSVLQGVPDGQSLGGVINLVKKKTKNDWNLATSANLGTWNNMRAEIDLNAPLTKNGKLRSRWVLFLNNRNFFYERSSMYKNGAYGVIDWDATHTTQISLSYAYQHAYGDVLYNGLPALRKTKEDQHRYHLPVDRTFNPTPNWDNTEWNTQEVMFSINQKITDAWKVSTKVGMKWQHQENKYASAGTVTATDSSSNYLWGYNDEYLPRLVSAIDVTGKFKMFDKVQRVFVGTNFENFIDDKKAASSYRMVKFGNPFLVPDFEVPYAQLPQSKMRVRQNGVYGQLRLALFDNLNVQLGTRMSSITASMYDFKGAQWNEAICEKYKFTPFAGITYDPVESVTTYASYSSIFVPQTERKENGDMLDPRTGHQAEVGAKTSFWEGRLTINGALFYLLDDGRAYKVPQMANTYINGGRVENKGADIELNAYPYKGLELTTSYTYLDTKITKSSSGDEGLAFSPVEPKHSFKLFATYRFENGLSIGANFMAFSTSYASVLTPERDQPSYALLNGFMSYDVNEKVSLYINGNNLTDKVYYSRVGGNGDFFGDPRNIMLGVRCAF